MMNKIIVKIKLDDLAKLKADADYSIYATENAARIRQENEQLIRDKAHLEQKIQELKDEVEQLGKTILELKHEVKND